MRKLCFLFLLCTTFYVHAQEQLFYNARIFTANPQQPYAEAIAINGKTIVAIGRYDEVKKKVSAQAVQTDMKGGFLMPGMIDSHAHGFWGGTELKKANLNDKAVTIAELVAYAKTQLPVKAAYTGDVLVINGINLATWSRIDEISQQFNSGEFANIPIALSGMDKHTLWANNTLLKRAGLNKQFLATVKPEDKLYYGITKDGESNGFTSEDGMHIVRAAIPKDINLQQSAQNTMAYFGALGITAFLDPSAAHADGSATEPLQGYTWLREHKELNAHVAATIVCDANGDAHKQLAVIKSLQQKYNGDNLSIIGCKVFADGVIEYPTQTAALSIPYTGKASAGVLMFDPKKFAQFAVAADKQHLLVHVHAIGDKAVTETLNGFEAVRKTNGNSGLPHTITHIQIAVPADFERFSKLNVLASMQMLWALGDFTTIDIVQPYVDPSLYKWQYPVRSMLHAGATICGASDWPVSTANPFEAIYRAETRRGSKGVLDSTQCLPRIDMLYAYTINAAKALMLEKKTGSLQPGKYADMILLDRDILTITPEAMMETRVRWTMFEGKKVYEAGK